MVIRSKYALSDTGHIEALKCVSSKNEDFYRELEKIGMLKIKKKHEKPHLLGEIVSKMKKIFTTFLLYWHSTHTPTMLTASTTEIHLRTSKFEVFLFVRSSPFVNFGNVRGCLLRLRTTLRCRMASTPTYIRTE